MELHSTFNSDSVLALFRETRSFDPDILDWRRSELRHRARAASRKGTVFLLSGLVATLTVVGAPIGVALLWAGWQLKRLGAQHVRAVERAFAYYTRPRVISEESESSEPEGGLR